jgi:transposase
MEKELYEVLLNLPNLRVDYVELNSKTIIINCHLDLPSGTCPSCLKAITNFKSYRTHNLRDLDISGRAVHLIVGVKQFYCIDCGRYFTQNIPFADTNKSHTHRQEKWIFELSIKQPFTQVGALLNVNTKTVERIFYSNSLPQGNERYEGLTHLGIDETVRRCDFLAQRQERLYLLFDQFKNWRNG